jgi:hypothetical protein
MFPSLYQFKSVRIDLAAAFAFRAGYACAAVAGTDRATVGMTVITVFKWTRDLAFALAFGAFHFVAHF